MFLWLSPRKFTIYVSLILAFFISFDNCLNIQPFRFHVSETPHQDEQTVACVDSLYETNASSNHRQCPYTESCIPLPLIRAESLETYQILTVVEALASRRVACEHLSASTGFPALSK